MVSEFDLNAEELDSFSEDDVKADLCITPSLMQRIEDRAAKFKVDDVMKDLAVMHLSMICPTSPSWGQVGQGWGFD